MVRDDYKKDRGEGKAAPTEKYWRIIPGESLYLLADKVSNLNLSYLAARPLNELAEATLRKYGIDANVAVQSDRLNRLKRKMWKEGLELTPNKKTLAFARIALPAE